MVTARVPPPQNAPPPESRSFLTSSTNAQPCGSLLSIVGRWDFSCHIVLSIMLTNECIHNHELPYTCKQRGLFMPGAFMVNKQTTSHRFVDDDLSALLAQASQLISSELHEVARQQGCSVSEWRVMASLAGGEAVSIGQLARLTVTKQSTVTRLLDRMEARGQVKRLPHESHRRITLVRITLKGLKAVEHLMDLAREHERRVHEPFGLRPAEKLKQTLRQMIDLHVNAPAAQAEKYRSFPRVAGLGVRDGARALRGRGVHVARSSRAHGRHRQAQTAAPADASGHRPASTAARAQRHGPPIHGETC